ncbi:sensor histidine kinase [Nannocystis radixulma]|uniref:histidine kinase n=1 Tax=Nannocystis radixulma TaxID=2995305 RepID=A0ABT5BD67_9BACT|nr:ATP-binding protein [Nannocystis radixulma]MDC0672084.1 ATP-binding protein [Nannocystis radixulma]
MAEGSHLESRLEHLIAVVQELSLARSLNDVTALVRHAARELVGADGATFVLRDCGQCFYADEEAISPLWKGKRFPLATCVSGWVMQHARSLVIPDVFVDPRIPTDVYRATFVKSMAMVPIRRTSPIGAIGTYWAHHRKTSEREVALLQALADSTSIALTNIELYNDLERRVRERTAQLQALADELESFAYAVSHDLRAPLRAIEGLSAAIAEDYANALDPRGRDWLARVRRSAERMDRMIGDMLGLSRVHAGASAPHRETVDVSALARSVAGELQDGQPAHRVHVVVADGLIAVADPGLLRVLLQNLLGNAFKFTRPRTEPTVEVGAREVDGELVYHVRDNGVGFDAARASELFGPFRRLHAESEFPGTGIGLATVQRIVRRHGGRAWAESSPGAGATFYFTLTPGDRAHVPKDMSVDTPARARPEAALVDVP